MSEGFDWPRMHKAESLIEQDITEYVYNYVLEFYEIEEIEELTQEQFDEIYVWYHQLSQYNIMGIGFSNLIAHLEGNYED